MAFDILVEFRRIGVPRLGILAVRFYLTTSSGYCSESL